MFNNKRITKGIEIPISRFVVSRNALSLAVLVFTLIGCANPYGLDIADIDYDERQIKGVIQFTDPKLYKREALINERRKEVEFLQKLLDASEAPEFDFEPEINRELEVISAISGSVSADFDPAAGINFQRDIETSDLQQQIAVTQLQMQLDQLERDAELLKDQLKEQEALSSPVAPPDGTVPDVSSPATTASAADLLTKIEATRATLRKTGTDLFIRPFPSLAAQAGDAQFDDH